MANPALVILQTLDRHLTAPAELRLMGGAALILGYGRKRATEDVDLLLEDEELQALANESDLGAALEATNRELEPRGLYISHIWGPEQQILTPGWRESCRGVELPVPMRYLRVSTLGPLDLIVSKLCRADDEDLADIQFLIDSLELAPQTVRVAMRGARVPVDFASVYPEACSRVEVLLLGHSRRE